MSVRVDGRVVRLTEDDFQDLVDGPTSLPALREALAVPGVPEALEAVRSPMAVLAVVVAGRGNVMSHHLWVTPDAVALLLQVREGERQLMALPPTLLASSLARLLRLGPRATGERAPRAVDSMLLPDLFAGTEILRRSAFDALAADVAWNVGMSWADGDRWIGGLDGRRGLDGLGGLWLVAGNEDAPRLEPVTATDIWRRLTRFLVAVDARPPEP